MGRGLATRGFLNAPPANLCAIVRERQFNSERWPRYGFSGATATERRPAGSIWRERERPSIPRAGGDQGAPLATRRRRRRIYAETAGIVPGSLVLIRILIGLPTGERPSLFNLADERVGGAVAKLFVQPWSGHCWPAAEVLDVEGLAASGGSGGHKAPAQLVVLPAQSASAGLAVSELEPAAASLAIRRRWRSAAVIGRSPIAWRLMGIPHS